MVTDAPLDLPTFIRRLRLEGVYLEADGQQLRAFGLSDALERWGPALSRHGLAIFRHIETRERVDVED